MTGLNVAISREFPVAKERLERWITLSEVHWYPQEIDKAQAVQGRYLHRMAMSEDAQTAVIFGGSSERLDGPGNIIFGEVLKMDLKNPRALSLEEMPTVAVEATNADEQPPRRNGPVARSSATVTLVGDSFWVFGGVAEDNTYLNDLWELKLTEEGGIWEEALIMYNADMDEADEDEDEIEPMHGPIERWGHTAVALGSYLVIFGGSAPGECFSDVWAVDTRVPEEGATREWLYQDNEESSDEEDDIDLITEGDNKKKKWPGSRAGH